jgi:ribosomal protein L30E
MFTLLGQLKELQENNPRYTNLFYRLETGKVVVGLEETFYDYDFQPAKLMEILQNYCYEWYNSVEIEVYFN